MPNHRHLIPPPRHRFAKSIVRLHLCKWLVAILWLLAWSGVVSPSEVFGQSKSEMPWYDASSGDIRPIGLEKRPEARTANRDSVPDYIPPKETNNSNNWNLNNRPNVSAATAGSLLSIFVWTISIIAAFAVTGIIIWLVFASRSGNSEVEDEYLTQRTIEESIKQLPFELETDQAFGDFRSLAQQMYQKGDLRRAMILLFSHVLVSLDQKGFVRLKKGKTNRQYLRELQPYQALGGYFGQVMVRFEEAFFGDRELEKNEFETCWNGLDGFMAGLESTRVNTDV